jgi:hypothetical protein
MAIIAEEFDLISFKGNNMNNPKVFISYSHDSPIHADRVLALSNRLRSDGIDCILDQYEPAPSESWPRWMDKQIQNTDFVLMICTETYYKRVMGEEKTGFGLGVRWEGHLIYQHLYQNGTINTKFIPILFQYSNDSNIPTPLRGFAYYQIDTDAGYDNLYRYLTNQLPQIPELGKLKQLPPLERRTDFFSPFMAPFLPERFVERPELFNKILAYLLETDRKIPV